MWTLRLRPPEADARRLGAAPLLAPSPGLKQQVPEPQPPPQPVLSAATPQWHGRLLGEALSAGSPRNERYSAFPLGVPAGFRDGSAGVWVSPRGQGHLSSPGTSLGAPCCRAMKPPTPRVSCFRHLCGLDQAMLPSLTSGGGEPSLGSPTEAESTETTSNTLPSQSACTAILTGHPGDPSQGQQVHRGLPTPSPH